LTAVSGKLYAIGGLAGDGNSNTVEIYDPKTDAWSRAHGMPTPRHGHATAVVNGTILAIGGYGGAGTVLVKPLAIVGAYDPADASGTGRGKLPLARGFMGAVQVAGAVYTFGGRTPEAPVERYLPSQDRWETIAPMPEPRQRFGIAEVSGDVYLIGGEEAPN